MCAINKAKTVTKITFAITPEMPGITAAIAFLTAEINGLPGVAVAASRGD
jgi:hypothetical protein